jgi:hypothetical protein
MALQMLAPSAQPLLGRRPAVPPEAQVEKRARIRQRRVMKRTQLQGFACRVHKVVKRAVLVKKLLDLGFVGQVNHMAGTAWGQRLQGALEALRLAGYDYYLGAFGGGRFGRR